MKKILAIGGAVIKTAREELANAIVSDKIEILIHNGGSLFHDFQLAIDPPPNNAHSYTIDHLMKDRSSIRLTGNHIEYYYDYYVPPDASITHLCMSLDIPVLIFTGLACDWWQFQFSNWSKIANRAKADFNYLKDRFKKDMFHYVCMGSAVIHPEVFLKALALSGMSDDTNWFTADVVDFLDMYRPRTRVAIYGTYYRTTHKEYLKGIL